MARWSPGRAGAAAAGPQRRARFRGPAALAARCNGAQGRLRGGQGMSRFRSIAVIGGGAWGTALAATIRRAGGNVAIWRARPKSLPRSIRRMRTRPSCLAWRSIRRLRRPAIWRRRPVRMRCCWSCRRNSCAASRRLSQRICRWRRRSSSRPRASNAATGAAMGEIVAELLPRNPWAVLSGPTFAIEVARGLPTAVTLAATDPALGRELVAAIGTASFRPYLGDDPVGCEIGGAVKNVLAIACGIVTGRGMGDNARAGPDHARPVRDGAARRRQGRQAGDADGAVGAGRSGPDLYGDAVAQLLARRGFGIRAEPGASAGRTQLGRRRSRDRPQPSPSWPSASASTCRSWRRSMPSCIMRPSSMRRSAACSRVPSKPRNCPAEVPLYRRRPLG